MYRSGCVSIHSRRPAERRIRRRGILPWCDLRRRRRPARRVVRVPAAVHTRDVPANAAWFWLGPAFANRNVPGRQRPSLSADSDSPSAAESGIADSVLHRAAASKTVVVTGASDPCAGSFQSKTSTENLAASFASDKLRTLTSHCGLGEVGSCGLGNMESPAQSIGCI